MKCFDKNTSYKNEMLYLYAMLVPEFVNLDNFNYLRSIVSEEIQKRINVLLKTSDKICTVLSEVLLRYVLQKDLDLLQEQIIFDYNHYGKPKTQRYV
jgi:4'-phosphopantetheinyl transferase